MKHRPETSTPRLIADAQCHNAECPVWHPDERQLYWTDIPQGRLYRYSTQQQQHHLCYETDAIGGLVRQADGALLLFGARGRIERYHRGKIEVVLAELPQERESRFNDVVADLAGRVFCGTMATPQRPGRLYRLEPDGSIHIVLEDVLVPNGMAFSLDEQQFFFTDSDRRTISVFDYDRRTGELSDRRTFIETPTSDGVPDGLAIDEEGCVWSARWDGGHLFRYSPRGEEVLCIPLPARKVSSVAFGGDNLDQLFITTAGGWDRATEGAGAGAVFQLDVGIQGKPEHCSRIQMSVEGKPKK